MKIVASLKKVSKTYGNDNLIVKALDNIPPKAVTATQVYKATLKGGKPTIFQLVSG